jgi:hypothetical protein
MICNFDGYINSQFQQKLQELATGCCITGNLNISVIPNFMLKGPCILEHNLYNNQRNAQCIGLFSLCLTCFWLILAHIQEARAQFGSWLLSPEYGVCLRARIGPSYLLASTQTPYSTDSSQLPN